MARLRSTQPCRRARRLLLVVLAASWPAALGCSGGDGAPPTAVGYFSQGDAICRELGADISELDFRSSQSEQEQEQAALDLGRLHRDASRSLLALRPPVELEADHAELVAIYEHFDAAVQSLEPLSEIRQRGRAFDDAVAEMGFEDCG